MKIFIGNLKRCYLFLAMMFVATVTKTTIDMELKGIKMAATIGDKFPVTANNIPIKL